MNGKYNFIDLDEPIEILGLSIAPSKIENPHIKRVIEEREYDFKFKFGGCQHHSRHVKYDNHERYVEYREYRKKYSEHKKSK